MKEALFSGRRQFAACLWLLLLVSSCAATGLEVENGRFPTSLFISSTTAVRFVEGVGASFLNASSTDKKQWRSVIAHTNTFDTTRDWTASCRFDVEPRLSPASATTTSHAQSRHTIVTLMLVDGTNMGSNGPFAILFKPPSSSSVFSAAALSNGGVAGDGSYFGALEGGPPSFAVGLALGDGSASNGTFFNSGALLYGIDGFINRQESLFPTDPAATADRSYRISDRATIPAVDGRVSSAMSSWSKVNGTRGAANSTVQSWGLELSYSSATGLLEVLLAVTLPPSNRSTPFTVVTYRSSITLLPGEVGALSPKAYLAFGFSTRAPSATPTGSEAASSFTTLKSLVLRDMRFSASPPSSSAETGLDSDAPVVARCRTNVLIPMVMPSTGGTDYFAYCTRRTFSMQEAKKSAAASGGTVASFNNSRDFDAVRKRIVVPCMLDPSSDRGTVVMEDPSPWWGLRLPSYYYYPAMTSAKPLLRAGPMVGATIVNTPRWRSAAASPSGRKTYTALWEGSNPTSFLGFEREYRYQPDLEEPLLDVVYGEGEPSPYVASIFALQPSESGEKFAAYSGEGGGNDSLAYSMAVPVEPAPYGSSFVSLLPSRSVGGYPPELFNSWGTFYLLRVSGSDPQALATARRAERLGNLCRPAFTGTIFYDSKISGATDVATMGTFRWGQWTPINGDGRIPAPGAITSTHSVITKAVSGYVGGVVHRQPTRTANGIYVEATIVFGRMEINDTSTSAYDCFTINGCYYGGLAISFLPVDDERDVPFLLTPIAADGTNRTELMATDGREPLKSMRNAVSVFLPLANSGEWFKATVFANGTESGSTDMFPWPNLKPSPDGQGFQNMTIQVLYQPTDLSDGDFKAVLTVKIQGMPGEPMTFTLPHRLEDYLGSEAAHIAITGRSAVAGFPWVQDPNTDHDESKPIWFESGLSRVAIQALADPSPPIGWAAFELSDFNDAARATSETYFGSNFDQVDGSACTPEIKPIPEFLDDYGLRFVNEDCIAPSENPLDPRGVRASSHLINKVDTTGSFRIRLAFDIIVEMQQDLRNNPLGIGPSLAAAHSAVSVILSGQPLMRILGDKGPGKLSGQDTLYFFGEAADGGYFETPGNARSLAIGLTFVTPSLDGTSTNPRTGQPNLAGREGANQNSNFPPYLATIALGINGLYNASYSFPYPDTPTATGYDGSSFGRIRYGTSWIDYATAGFASSASGRGGRMPRDREPLNADGTRKASGTLPWVYGDYSYSMEVVYRKADHEISVLVTANLLGGAGGGSSFYAENFHTANAKFHLPADIDLATFFTNPNPRPADDPAFSAAPRLAVGFSSAGTGLETHIEQAAAEGIQLSAYPLVNDFVIRSLSFSSLVDAPGPDPDPRLQQNLQQCRPNVVHRSPKTGAGYAYCSARLLSKSEAKQAAAYAATLSPLLSSAELLSEVGNTTSNFSFVSTASYAEFDWLRSEVIGPCVVGEGSHTVTRHDSLGTARIGPMIDASVSVGLTGFLLAWKDDPNKAANHADVFGATSSAGVVSVPEYGTIHPAKIAMPSLVDWYQDGVPRTADGPASVVHYIQGPTRFGSSSVQESAGIPAYGTSVSLDVSDYGNDTQVERYGAKKALFFLMRVPQAMPPGSSTDKRPFTVPNLCHPPPWTSTFHHMFPLSYDNWMLVGAREDFEDPTLGRWLVSEGIQSFGQTAAEKEVAAVSPGYSSRFVTSALVSRRGVNVTRPFTVRLNASFPANAKCDTDVEGASECFPPSPAGFGGYALSLLRLDNELLLPLQLLPPTQAALATTVAPFGKQPHDENDWKQPTSLLPNALTVFRVLSPSSNATSDALHPVGEELYVSAGGVKQSTAVLGAIPESLASSLPHFSTWPHPWLKAAYVSDEDLTISYNGASGVGSARFHRLVVTTRSLFFLDLLGVYDVATSAIAACPLVVRRSIVDVPDAQWQTMFAPSDGLAYISVVATGKRGHSLNGGFGTNLTLNFAMDVASVAYEPASTASDSDNRNTALQELGALLPASCRYTPPTASPSATSSASASSSSSSSASPSISPASSSLASSSPSTSPAVSSSATASPSASVAPSLSASSAASASSSIIPPPVTVDPTAALFGSPATMLLPARYRGAPLPSFSGPSSLAYDPFTGDVFVAAWSGHAVHAMGSAGVRIFAGKAAAGQAATPDSALPAVPATNASFPSPRALAYHAPSCALFLTSDAITGDRGSSIYAVLHSGIASNASSVAARGRQCSYPAALAGMSVAARSATAVRGGSSLHLFAPASATVLQSDGDAGFKTTPPAVVALASEPCSPAPEVFGLLLANVTTSAAPLSNGVAVALFNGAGARTLIWLGKPAFSLPLPGDVVVPGVRAYPTTQVLLDPANLSVLGRLATSRVYTSLAVRSSNISLGNAATCGAAAASTDAAGNRHYTVALGYRDTAVTTVVALKGATSTKKVSAGLLLFSVSLRPDSSVASTSAASTLSLSANATIGWPSSIAIASADSIIVADREKGRIVLLAPELNSTAASAASAAAADAAASSEGGATVATDEPGDAAFKAFEASSFAAVLYPLSPTAVTPEAVMNSGSAAKRALQQQSSSSPTASSNSTLISAPSAIAFIGADASASLPLLLIAEEGTGMVYSLGSARSLAASMALQSGSTPTEEEEPPSASPLPATDDKASDEAFAAVATAGGIAAGIIAVIVLVPLLILLCVFVYLYRRQYKRKADAQRAALLRSTAAERLRQVKEAGAEASSSAVVDALSASLLLTAHAGDASTATPEVATQAREALAASVADELLSPPDRAEDDDARGSAALMSLVGASISPDALQAAVRQSLETTAEGLKDSQATLALLSSDAPAAASGAATGSKAPSAVHRALIGQSVRAVTAKAAAASEDGLAGFLLQQHQDAGGAGDSTDPSSSKRARLEQLALAASSFLSEYYLHAAESEGDAASLSVLPLQAVLEHQQRQGEDSTDAAIDLARSRMHDRAAAAAASLGAADPLEEGNALVALSVEEGGGEDDDEGEGQLLRTAAGDATNQRLRVATKDKAAARTAGATVQKATVGLSAAKKSAQTTAAQAASASSLGAAATFTVNRTSSKQQAQALRGGALRTATSGSTAGLDDGEEEEGVVESRQDAALAFAASIKELSDDELAEKALEALVVLALDTTAKRAASSLLLAEDKDTAAAVKPAAKRGSSNIGGRSSVMTTNPLSASVASPAATAVNGRRNSSRRSRASMNPLHRMNDNINASVGADDDKALRRLVEQQLLPARNKALRAQSQARREAWVEAKQLTLAAARRAILGLLSPCIRRGDSDIGKPGSAPSKKGDARASQRFYVSRSSLHRGGIVTPFETAGKRVLANERIYVQPLASSSSKNQSEGRRGSALASLIESPPAVAGALPVSDTSQASQHQQQHRASFQGHQFVSPMLSKRRSFAAVSSEQPSAALAHMKATSALYGASALYGGAAAVAPSDSHYSYQRRRSSAAMLPLTSEAGPVLTDEERVARAKQQALQRDVTSGLEQKESAFAGVSPLLLQQRSSGASSAIAGESKAASAADNDISAATARRQRILLQFAAPSMAANHSQSQSHASTARRSSSASFAAREAGGSFSDEADDDGEDDGWGGIEDDEDDQQEDAAVGPATLPLPPPPPPPLPAAIVSSSLVSLASKRLLPMTSSLPLFLASSAPAAAVPAPPRPGSALAAAAKLNPQPSSSFR